MSERTRAVLTVLLFVLAAFVIFGCSASGSVLSWDCAVGRRAAFPR
jgi:hypothetical protein